MKQLDIYTFACIVSSRYEMIRKIFDAGMPGKSLSDKLDQLLTRLDRIEERLQLLEENSDRNYRHTDELYAQAIYTHSHVKHFEYMWQTNQLLKEGNADSYYLYRHVRAMNELFPMYAPPEELVRIGGRQDGGYLMLEDFTGRELAYSFGICDDVSWDRAMAERGFQVYMYDHTIGGLPEENAAFHWQKKGLTGNYDPEQPELETLAMFLAENGHEERNRMILKMDIEGCEWEVFARGEAELFNRFSQIVLELHGLNDVRQGELMRRALKRLNETHGAVHVHGNNCDKYLLLGGMILPDTLEITYLNKSEYQLKESTTFFPTEQDRLNAPRNPEIVLGCFGRR